MATKRKTATDEAPFELVMERLEGLVDKLEQGELSLEDSLAAYEQGIGLVRLAQGRLDAMDARLEQLSRDGRIVPFGEGPDEEPIDPMSLRHPPPASEDEFDDDSAG